LAATEVHGVHTVLDRADDIFGIVLPGEHVSVGHARHGNVLVAFATAVTGVSHSHQEGRELVAEVSLQNSIFDQDCVLGGLTFVVHVERSTAPGHGAVVDYGAFFAGYTLADEPGKRRSLLAIEVSLESMTYGF